MSDTPTRYQIESEARVKAIELEMEDRKLAIAERIAVAKANAERPSELEYLAWILYAHSFCHQGQNITPKEAFGFAEDFQAERQARRDASK